ncbi:aldose 1-epimerase [Enterococcus sp. PF1-24]|uniref:aldose epimerase family protein n=1 Tax=unclassified Enterococcus TaxID=2608891 RepID=UPI00247559AA|nr:MULTISPECIES: aldose epimerase family protein [unclassified Enterococcus]MDH6365733.1 aldose 1-epimerase [Enterococcus sp. PFB1-1]MDH6402826.1 aldose 1-epimerase [Enterococcus sp. PF1-24]
MKKELFGKLANDQEVHLYTIETDTLKLTASDLGGLIVKLEVPDKNGVWRDVVLGFDTLNDYLEKNAPNFGANVGRNANRTANACFKIDDIEYQMPANEGINNLHSGPNTLQLRLWEMINAEENKLVFALDSLDGDQGFPGNMRMSVAYVVEDGGVTITYDGLSDKKTVFNMTNHSYFNLNGHDQGTILNHQLQMNANYYTPVIDSNSIPTGKLANVAETPMNFLTAKTIGAEIDADFEQLQMTGGYDHNFVLNKGKDQFAYFAKAVGDQSGIAMEVATDLPGVQLYTGNFLDGLVGKNQVAYQKRAAFCLETQYFPNSLNEENFEAPLIEAMTWGTHVTRYQFSVAE